MWLLILLSVLAVLVYLNILKPHKYWREKGIPYVKPVPIFGNMASAVFRRRPFFYMLEDLYKDYPDKRYVGIYQFLLPTFMIRDPELIKRITVKEFDTFPDHRTITTPDDPLFSRNLVCLSSKNGWQDMRATLSPCFTSSKMKIMFVLMQQCAQQFIKFFEDQQGTVEVDLKDVLTRFTNDVIATTAFGITCDSLKNRENEFYMMGKDVSNVTGGVRALKFFGYTVSPWLMKVLKVKIFSKKIDYFFRGLISETIKLREEKQIIRPDMVHLLLKAKKGRESFDDMDETPDSGFAVVQESELGKTQRKQKAPITEEDITAQALIFFLGGFETASTLMCHICYELAVNPDVQEKLRKEVDSTLEACKDQLSYEALLGMKYLDNVVSETLRKWPLVPFLDRLSNKPFTIEPELPGEKSLYVEPGTVCWIPVFGIHRDSKYYPHPEKFDPDRFSDGNKHNIKPFTYIPFGSGPRNCIGSRFALLENKLIIVELLRKFELVPTKKTEIPLVLSKKNFNPVSDAGFWLGLRPRLPN